MNMHCDFPANVIHHDNITSSCAVDFVYSYKIVSEHGRTNIWAICANHKKALETNGNPLIYKSVTAFYKSKVKSDD